MGVRKLRTQEKRPDLYKTFIVLSDEKPAEQDTVITTIPVIAEEENDSKPYAPAFVDVPISVCKGDSEDFFKAYKKAAEKYGRIRQSLFSLIMAAIFFLAFFMLFIAILASPKGIIFKDNCKPVNFTNEMLHTCQQYLNASLELLHHDVETEDSCRAMEYLQSCVAVSVAMITKGSCSMQEKIGMAIEAKILLSATLNMTSKTCKNMKWRLK